MRKANCNAYTFDFRQVLEDHPFITLLTASVASQLIAIIELNFSICSVLLYFYDQIPAKLMTFSSASAVQMFAV